MAKEAHGADLVENFELGPLGFAPRAVVVFFLFAGFVEIFDFLGELEDAVFNGVDGGMEVDVVVIFIDGTLLAFAGLLTRVTDRMSQNQACLGGAETDTAKSLSSLSLPQSLRRSFCCIPRSRARSSLGRLRGPVQPNLARVRAMVTNAECIIRASITSTCRVS